ncbi:MAG: hypothetical protein M3115_02950, partial [Thermoproteota archaeon]|nr:hypothetical protein [Thermoproteota archaeon]
MSREAKSLRLDLVSKEQGTDEVFSNGTVTEEKLRLVTAKSADLYSKSYLFIHLSTQMYRGY